MSTGSIARIARRNMNDEVYDVLKESIRKRRLHPGQRLDLKRMGDTMGISRTPLKDALNRLATEGLIDIVPRKGTFVSRPSIAKVSEMVEVRLALELYAVESLVPHLPRGLIARLRAVLDQMARALDGKVSRQGYRRYIALDSGWHRLIIESLKNRYLAEIWDLVSMRTLLARYHYLAAEQQLELDVKEHRGILNAFAERDLAGVREALSAHIRRAGKLLTQQMKAHHGSSSGSDQALEPTRGGVS